MSAPAFQVSQPPAAPLPPDPPIPPEPLTPPEVPAPLFGALQRGDRTDVNILFPQGVPDELVLMVIAVCLMIVIVAVGVPIVRLITNRLMRHPEARLPGDAAQRLERIETAVETMAVEVERISEAQRYSAQLLTETTRSLQALRLPRDSGSGP